MSDDTAGKQAIDGLNDSDVQGRTIKVTEARPKEDKPRNKGYEDRGNFNKGRW